MQSGGRYEDKRRSPHDAYNEVQRKQKGYRTDDTIGKTEGSVLDNLIVGAAIFAGGFALYRSGGLKGIIKGTMGQLDNYKGYLPELSNTIKMWSKASTEAPSGSAFRLSHKDGIIAKFKNLANDPKQSMIASAKDMSDLGNELVKRFNELKKTKRGPEVLANSDLSMAVTRTRNIVNNSEISSDKKDVLMSKFASEISDVFHTQVYKDGAISYSEEIKNKLKREGVRPLVLGDFVQKIHGRLALNPNVNKFDTLFKNETEFMENINRELKERVVAGSTLFDDDNVWMNLRIDANLHIDEQMKIYDSRTIRNHVHQVTKDFSNELEIPLLGINPLRMMGFQDAMNKKVDFALLKKGYVNPAITGVAGRSEEALLKEDHFFMNGRVFKFNDNNELEMVSENMTAHKVATDDSHKGISMYADKMAKMAGLDHVTYSKFSESDGWKYYFEKAADFLEIGKPTSMQVGQFNLFDSMSHINIVNRLTEKAPFYKERYVINVADTFGSAKTGEDIFFVAKQRAKLNDVEGVLTQLTAGRNDLKNVSPMTMWTYYMGERLNSSLNTVSLGLSIDSLSDLGSVMKGLLLKRVLPVFIGVEAWKLINYETDAIFGKEAEDAIAETVVGADLTWHKLKDAVGITALAKELTPLLPGGEQLSGIPGFGILDMNETHEERKDFWENGEVAVRKGRFWSLGNTPFTGGKVEYYAPNWYREIKADVEFTDVKYGSADEYFKYSWIPTIQHPFAPINKLLDPYHWENKHYNDRPYLLTSPAFSETPIIGPALGATVGQIIKPTKRMHLEYWAAPRYDDMVAIDLPFQEGGTLISEEESEGYIGTGDASAIPITEAGTLTSKPMGQWEAPKFTSRKGIYTTSGGQMDIVSIPNEFNTNEVNMKLSKDSLAGIRGAFTVMTGRDKDITSLKTIESPIAPMNVVSDEYNMLTDLGGIYGFGLESVTGPGLGVKGSQVATPGYAYSLNREFWDRGVGGLGGELSEIYRRFFPKQRKDIEYYNPVRNTQASWMPGEDYFIDFQHGDPYTKVARGESRLPGEGYEKLNNINDPTYLGIGSSFFGKSKTDLIKHFLKMDTITDDGLQDIVDTGSKQHKAIQKLWAAEGFLIDSEVEVNDKQNQVIGYYDARVYDPTSTQGQAIAEIKTVNTASFDKLAEAKETHKSQLNFYLMQTGFDKGYIYYYDRDMPEKAPKVFTQYRDEKLYKENIANLQAARNTIKEGLSSGKIGRGELYEYFDRFRVLADVAPFSKQYKEYTSIVSRMDLTDEQREEAKAIRDQVADKKNALRLYPYRFKTANLQYRTVTVDHIITNDMFAIKEMPDTPIKFAGIDVPQGSGDINGSTEFLQAHLRPGQKVKIGFTADPLDIIAGDTYKTIKAVVHADGVNLNRVMLQKDMAKEKVDDYSAAAVHARFNSFERSFGSAWESIAHLHTYTNTKLLQVRSPYESYLRRDVYGKDFQKWTNPVKDFLIPTFETKIAQDLTVPLAMFVGSLFGAKRSLYGRVVGAGIGGGIALIGELTRAGYESNAKENWVPQRRRDERTMNEYMDVLKFIKHKKLYAEYAEKAKREGTNIEQIISTIEGSGGANKARKSALEKAKRSLKTSDEWEVKRVMSTIKPKYGNNDMNNEDLITAINKEIKDIGGKRKFREMSKTAMKAVEHYQAAEATMYGYDAGDPLQNLLAALPKKDRRYFQDLLQAPEEEKLKILDIAPKYMRRGLEAGWGLEVEEKTNLLEYFTEHQLPDADWMGWREDVSLDSVKVKMVRKDGLDPGEFDIWPDDVDQANLMGEVPLPYLNKGQSNTIETKKKLERILHAMGMRDVDVQAVVTGGTVDLDLELSYDRREEIKDAINKKSHEVFK